jgi:hypothetical protein
MAKRGNGKTRQEVAKKLTTALKTREQGLPFTPDRLTVARYLDECAEGNRPECRRAPPLRAADRLLACKLSRRVHSVRRPGSQCLGPATARSDRRIPLW